jgi:Transglycosylase SLT domain
MSTIEYLTAGTWAKVIHALAIHESNEDPNAIGGDNGCAFGILQMHMDFVTEWAPHANIESDDTVTQAQIKIATAYFKHYDALGWTLQAMVEAYNEGVGAYQAGIPDPLYWQGFEKIYNSL